MVGLVLHVEMKIADGVQPFLSVTASCQGAIRPKGALFFSQCHRTGALDDKKYRSYLDGAEALTSLARRRRRCVRRSRIHVAHWRMWL